MRRAVILVVLVVLLLPHLAVAQDLQRNRGTRRDARAIDTELVLRRMQSPLAIEDCFNCVLGIWDDPGLTQRTGTITPGVPKDIYVGVQYSGSYNELTGIEFSISGIRQVEDGILVIGVQGVTPNPPNIILGSAPAPADTSSTSTGTGGLNVVWPTCVVGSQALVKVTILSFSPINQKVLWVKRRYPPTNNEWHTPVFVQCDAPEFTATRVSGSCYGLNYTGPLPCETTPNFPPVCDAGGPYSPPCTNPTTSVTLDGTGSHDPEGLPLSYLWTTDCPGAVIFNSTNAIATLLLPTPPGSNTSCSVFLTVNDGQSATACSTSVTVQCAGPPNQPPVCDAGGPYTGLCAGPTTSIQLDGSGSFDPDPGDTVSWSWSSDCPGASFDDPTSPTPTLVLDSRCCPISCRVTLVVSDGQASSSCSAAVEVVGDTEPPAALVLWPPNHQYERIDPTDCVTDGCRPGGAAAFAVVSVRSDEAEDARGQGDGATVDDIVIECPDVVLLRAERAGNGDGRVYTITYEVTDPLGTRRVECKVSVPHDQSGAPAVEGPGPGYSVAAVCGGASSRPQTSGAGSLVTNQATLKTQLSRGAEPGIAVSFALEESGPVALDVYDVAGRQVASVRTELLAGSHVLRWDGRDNDGREVANGIYLMQLRAGGTVQRSKALWMR